MLTAKIYPRKCFYGIRRRMSNGISCICMKIRGKAMYVKWNNSSPHSILSSGFLRSWIYATRNSFIPFHCHRAIISFIIIQLSFTILYIFCCCRLYSEWENFLHFKQEDGSNTTERAVEEGRYIKGDPLNGYYDFVITEGSYKFWVVFQVSE